MSRLFVHPLLDYHFRPTVGVFGSESSSDRLVIARGIFCYDVINQLAKGVCQRHSIAPQIMALGQQIDKTARNS